MKYLRPIDETARALGFLTRLPIPSSYFKNIKPEQMSDCAGFYPVAGALIGAVAGAVILLAGLLGLSPIITATLAITAMLVLTGALHEDGMADVADGFGGGSTIQKRLEIMKDSRVGTYGVLAVGLSLLLRVTCLSAIVGMHGTLAGTFAVIAAASLSRGAMVWFWASMPSARSDGVAASFGQPNDNAVSLAAIFALLIGLLFAIMASGFISAGTGLGLSLLAMLGFQRLCMRMIDGQTGDTMGACQQVVEITFLLGLATQTGMPT